MLCVSDGAGPEKNVGWARSVINSHTIYSTCSLHCFCFRINPDPRKVGSTTLALCENSETTKD